MPVLVAGGAGYIGSHVSDLAAAHVLALVALIADPSRLMATLPWQPQHADLDAIVADALVWEARLSEIRAAA